MYYVCKFLKAFQQTLRFQVSWKNFTKGLSYHFSPMQYSTQANTHKYINTQPQCYGQKAFLPNTYFQMSSASNYTISFFLRAKFHLKMFLKVCSILWVNNPAVLLSSLPFIFFKVVQVQRVDSLCYIKDVLWEDWSYFQLASSSACR